MADWSPVRADLRAVVACLAFSLLALLLPASWTIPLSGLIRETVLWPVVWVERRAEEDRAGRARLLEALAERDSLRMALRELPELATENARLRATLDLRDRLPASRAVTVEVLRQGLPTAASSLVLSAGRGQDVAPFLPVITEEGLLGVIAAAGRSTSVAYTWAHEEFRVSAVTEDGAVLGIVAPSTEGVAERALLEFRGVAYRDTVPEGTLLVTSGLGGVYPRGIPVGRVRGVRREELGWERIYLVVPAVNPGTVRVAMVLRDRRAPVALGDTAGLAPDSGAARRSDSVVRPAPVPR